MPNWEVLRLGPFTGGLNTAADRSVVDDEELIQCLNFELDIDGSLVQRPAIDVIFTGAQNERHLIFGSVELNGTLYLFATRNGETFVSSTGGTSWSELAPDGTNRECVTMAVYQDTGGVPTVWLPATPASTGGGMKWTPGGGAVAVADMPRGTACVIHKNRLYICPGENATSNESRLHFSEAADPNTWPGTDFIDVNAGDGTTLNNVIVYQNNLLLFKEDSTFVLAYDLDPIDALLQEINPVVGTNGSFGVVQHENTAYCLHNGNVYAIVNHVFQLLNLKVPFEFDDSLPANTSARFEPQHLSVLGDRIVARYFNKTYVYNVRTQTWSEWAKTDATVDTEWHIFGPLVRGELISGLNKYAYYTSYSFTVSTGYRVFKILDGRNTTATEGFGTNVMHCIATTKDYDMADPVRYKRLFWWGADVLTGNDITADVEPITLSFVPTWSDLGNLEWQELETWGNPTMTSLPTQTVITGDGNFATGRMVKFLKSLRFRKVNFSVMLECDGSSLEPTKIFSYIAVVRTKQLVSKESS